MKSDVEFIDTGNSSEEENDYIGDSSDKNICVHSKKLKFPRDD